MAMGRTELQVLTFCCWKRQLLLRDAAKLICDAEDERTMSHVIAAKWHKRFGSGELDSPETGAILVKQCQISQRKDDQGKVQLFGASRNLVTPSLWSRWCTVKTQ
ncbi:hypothetical protein KIN20_000678 [Parelaphostrongylus tenuis]|uniref:Mos1 transposase HTH domain-containing protein n=1 Tax=Parelaphostrongylus tenuis TaxID=148309 RepID=A0AAD5QE20_PARTN|nr:hypothetical protein KIN20_000678 [Parelaphostrongylus tenuis]